jgi:hypothetical protein
MTRTKKKNKGMTKPKVDPELEGLEIGINTFGEIQTSMEIEKINEFLNEHLQDKKLQNKIRKNQKDS